MFKKLLLLIILIASSTLIGCATVPMASLEDDQARKQFAAPAEGTSGLYIFRDSSLGAALKKSVFVDDALLGETASNTYFYKEVSPGEHKVSTESEFSNNDLMVQTESGKNYFIRQYIKLGMFVGGANLELVSEEEGQKGVLECKLAKPASQLSLNSPQQATDAN